MTDGSGFCEKDGIYCTRCILRNLCNSRMPHLSPLNTRHCSVSQNAFHTKQIATHGPVDESVDESHFFQARAM